MSAFFEKATTDPQFPVRSYINNDSCVVCHHWHEEIEIVLVTEGKLTIGVNNVEHKLSTGDILIISSGDIHYFPLSVGSRRCVLQFSLNMFEDFNSISKNKKELLNLLYSIETNSQHWQSKVLYEFAGHMFRIQKEFDEKRPGYMLAIKARLFDIILLMYRKIPKCTGVSDKIRYPLPKETIYRLENIFKFVEENYEKELSLKRVADEFGFDVFYFAKFFKKSTGITFGDFLCDYRLTKAQWHLINESSAITEISYKVGFQSVKTFNRQFKSLLGISPSEFRKRQNMRS